MFGLFYAGVTACGKTTTRKLITPEPFGHFRHSVSYVNSHGLDTKGQACWTTYRTRNGLFPVCLGRHKGGGEEIVPLGEFEPSLVGAAETTRQQSEPGLLIYDSNAANFQREAPKLFWQNGGQAILVVVFDLSWDERISRLQKRRQANGHPILDPLPKSTLYRLRPSNEVRVQRYIKCGGGQSWKIVVQDHHTPEQIVEMIDSALFHMKNGDFHLLTPL